MPFLDVLSGLVEPLRLPTAHDDLHDSDGGAALIGGLSSGAARRATAAFQTALAGPGHQEAISSLSLRSGGVKRAARDVGSFLGSAVGHKAGAAATADAVSSTAAPGAARASDFLFADAAPTLLRARGGSHEVAKKVTVIDLDPHMSMMSGASIFAAADSCGDKMSRNPVVKLLDITHSDQDDTEENPLKGWSKAIPRGIRVFWSFDLLSIALLTLSHGAMCDQPLRTWLFGGLLLGLPTTWLVNKFAKCQPDYMFYRMTVLETRNGGKDDVKVGKIMFYDRMGAPIVEEEAGRPPVMQRPDKGGFWYVDMPFRTLIIGYQVITHDSASASDDPTAWELHGSYNGIDWELVHEVNPGDIDAPSGRNASYPRIDEMYHLEDSAAIFRAAFALETLANVASFFWLLQGTSWVAQGAEECVDSAPTLFYSCYLLVVMTWSLIGTFTMGLIVTAVAMVFLGVKAPAQR